MLGDNSCLACSVDQHVEISHDGPLVKRKEIFYKQPVVKQEQERRKEADVDNGCRNKIMIVLIIEEEIKKVDADQVQDQHIEYAYSVLCSRIPDDPFVATRYSDAGRTDDQIQEDAKVSVILENILKRKIEPQKVGEENRKGNKTQVNGHNDPSRQNAKVLDRPPEKFVVG
jgi:hypothetical protein